MRQLRTGDRKKGLAVGDDILKTANDATIRFVAPAVMIEKSKEAENMFGNEEFLLEDFAEKRTHMTC